MDRKKRILKQIGSTVIVDFEEWKEFYFMVEKVNKYGFHAPDVFEDDGSYSSPSGKYFTLSENGSAFAPYDLARVLGYL